MYAVIFRATINKLDDEYLQMAQRLREDAFRRYGCLDFTSLTAGDQELTVSYWKTEEAIARWKADPEHIRAQMLGRKKWYRTYTVQIVEIVREYRKDEGEGNAREG